MYPTDFKEITQNMYEFCKIVYESGWSESYLLSDPDSPFRILNIVDLQDFMSRYGGRTVSSMAYDFMCMYEICQDT